MFLYYRKSRFAICVAALFMSFVLFAACDTIAPSTESLSEAPGVRNAAKVKIKGLKSLVVWHDGQIVSEQYFKGAQATDLQHVRSVTKSVVSLLLGIAIEEGYIDSLDDTLGDYLQGVANLNDKDTITLRQLATMTTGIQWDEIGGYAYSRWIAAPNQVQHVLDQPMQHQPGTFFNYNTGATHLLGVVISEATGMSLLEFADLHLFGPLGISQRAWDLDKQGFYYGGVGLQLRTTDAIHLGQLVLQDGVFNSVQVVPASWIAASTQEQWPLNLTVDHLADVDYGYLWWINDTNPEDVILGWGYAGQFIYTVPSKNLIVATNASWNVSSRVKGRQETDILNHIANNVLPLYP